MRKDNLIKSIEAEYEFLNILDSLNLSPETENRLEFLFMRYGHLKFQAGRNGERNNKNSDR